MSLLPHQECDARSSPPHCKSKKTDFFLMEDTRLTQTEWDSFPHSQQPPNTSQRHPRHRLLVLMTAIGGEVQCCLCSGPWECQNVFPGGHWLLCGNTALQSLQFQAQLGETWPMSLCFACLIKAKYCVAAFPGAMAGARFLLHLYIPPALMQFDLQKPVKLSHRCTACYHHH